MPRSPEEIAAEIARINADENLTAAQRIEKIAELTADHQRKSVDYLKQQTELLKTIAEQTNDENDKLDEIISKHEEKIQKLRNEIKLSQEEGEIDKVAVERLRHRIKLRDQDRKKQEELNESISRSGKAGEDFARFLGLGATYQETMIGKFHKFSKDLSKGGKQAEKFVENFKEANVVGALLAGTFSKIVEASTAEAILMDQVAASFMAATQASQEFNQAMLDAGRGATALGVGTEEAGRAGSALYNGFNSFTNLSKESASEFTRTVASMEQLGISGEDAAANLNLFNKSLGLGTAASMDLQVHLVEAGTAIGVSMAKTSQQVKEAETVFIQFGHAVGTKVFKELQKQAKKTGLEISDLISITEEFRTFEGAATAAGRLNAMLGGNLFNSVEMMTMSHDEMIESIRNGIVATMGSFDAMGMMEQRMVANVIAGGDLVKASKLLTQQTQAQIQETKTLTEAAEQAQTLTKQFTLFVANLTMRNKDLIDSIKGIITTMNQWMDDNPVWTQIITGLVLAIGAIFVATTLLGPAFKLIGLALAGFTLAAAPAAGGILAIGQAAMWSVVGLGILALTFAAIAAAVYLAGQGFLAMGQGISNATKNTVAFAKAISSIDKAKELVFKATVDHYAKVVQVSKDAGPDILTKATNLARSLTVNIDKNTPINEGATKMQNAVGSSNRQPINITVQLGNKKVGEVLDDIIQKKIREAVQK